MDVGADDLERADAVTAADGYAVFQKKHGTNRSHAPFYFV